MRAGLWNALRTGQVYLWQLDRRYGALCARRRGWVSDLVGPVAARMGDAFGREDERNACGGGAVVPFTAKDERDVKFPENLSSEEETLNTNAWFKSHGFFLPLVVRMTA